MRKIVFLIIFALFPISITASGKILIKRSDFILDYFLSVVKSSPLIPANDTRLSRELAQSLKKITGTETPTLDRLKRILLSLPPSPPSDRLRYFFLSNQKGPPSAPQLKNILYDIHCVAHGVLSHNNYNMQDRVIRRLPVSMPPPLKKFSNPGRSYGEEFSMAWNNAAQDVRLTFLQYFWKKHNLDDATLLQKFLNRFIIEPSLSVKFYVDERYLISTFENNIIYGEYLLITYIFQHKSSHKLKSIYTDMAAKEWSKLTPNQLQTMESMHKLNPQQNLSHLERQQAYIDLVLKKLQEMDLEIRDHIIKDYGFWQKELLAHSDPIQKEVIERSQLIGLIPTALETNISPTLILKWAQKRSVPLRLKKRRGEGYSNRFKEAALEIFFDIKDINEAAKRLQISSDLLAKWVQKKADQYPQNIKQIGVWLEQNIGIDLASEELEIPSPIINLWIDEGVALSSNEDIMFEEMGKLGIDSIMFFKRNNHLYTPEQRKEVAIELNKKAGAKITGKLLGVDSDTVEKWLKQGPSTRRYYPDDLKEKTINDTLIMSYEEAARSNNVDYRNIQRWKQMKASTYSKEERLKALDLAAELNSAEDAASQLGLDLLFLKSWHKELSNDYQEDILKDATLIGREAAAKKYGYHPKALERWMRDKAKSYPDSYKFMAFDLVRKFKSVDRAAEELNLNPFIIKLWIKEKKEYILNLIPSMDPLDLSKEFDIERTTLWRWRRTKAKSYSKEERRAYLEKAKKYKSHEEASKELNIDALFLDTWKGELNH